MYATDITVNVVRPDSSLAASRDVSHSSHSGKSPESALFLQDASQVITQQYGSKLQMASQQSNSLQPTDPFDS